MDLNFVEEGQLVVDHVIGAVFAAVESAGQGLFREDFKTESKQITTFYSTLNLPHYHFS